MASQRTFNVFNILAIICGLWHTLLGWAWFYLFNVIFVFPIAIAGFILWWFGRKAEKKTLNKIAGWLLVIGTVASIGTLLYWQISEKS